MIKHQIKLSQVATIKGGKRLPKGHDFISESSAHSYIRARDIKNKTISLNEPVYITDDTFQHIKNYTVQTNDVCVTIVGANVGEVGIVPLELNGANLTENAVKLRAIENSYDQHFLFYSLQLPEIQTLMKSVSDVAAQQKLGLYKIKEIDLPYPSLTSQQKIGNTLKSYDDLIENNLRRIELLENSARLIYKEWFVKLNFPGREHTKIVDGVPVGWKKAQVNNLGEVITGKTPPTKDEANFGYDIPFVKTPDMHKSSIIVDTEQYLSEKGANLQSNKYLPEGAILVACIGAKLGVVSIAGRTVQTNQQINSIVVSEPYLQYFAYFVACDLRPRLEALGGGATMPNVNKSKFESLPFVLPSKNVLVIFNDYCTPIFSQIKNLIHQNIKLKQARDILLPKLMSGEIAV